MAYSPASAPAFGEKVYAFMNYFERRVDEEVALRRETPQDDLLTLLATGTIDGEPLDRDRIQALAFNIMAGGVDTTTSLTSNALLYLGRRPDQRRRLIDEPELLPLACEEFVRYVSPIQGLARNAKRDVEVNGWRIDEGDRVLLAYASANRDPEAFDDPDELRLDRYPNKHIGFGVGMHRCLGSFLARLMFQVMMTEVLTRMPDYRIEEEGIQPYHTIAKVNGWIHIPATFTPSKKVGAIID
jgi:cytochrome P450